MGFIYTVPQNHVVLIERFGKYVRTQNSGLRMYIPFIEKRKTFYEWGKVATKRGINVELSDQQTDTPSRRCQTSDNVTIEADATIYWKITNPIKAAYEVDILPKSVKDIALNSLRSNIGKFSLDQLLSERDRLNENIKRDLDKVSNEWGIVFKSVEIQEISYSDEIADAMMQEMAAERKKRAIIAEAEGLSKSMIMKAEAEAKSMEIRGDSESDYISKITNSLDKKSALELILSQKYIDGMEVISAKKGDKIYLPNNFRGLIES